MANETLDDGVMLSVPEVRALLDKEREDRGELSYEQKLAYEHALALDRIGDGEKAVELRAELMEKVERITEAQAIKIADIAPQHPDEVELVFAKDRQALSKEDSDTIISIVEGYLD